MQFNIQEANLTKAQMAAMFAESKERRQKIKKQGAIKSLSKKDIGVLTGGILRKRVETNLQRDLEHGVKHAPKVHEAIRTKAYNEFMKNPEKREQMIQQKMGEGMGSQLASPIKGEPLKETAKYWLKERPKYVVKSTVKDIKSAGKGKETKKGINFKKVPSAFVKELKKEVSDVGKYYKGKLLSIKKRTK